MTAVYREEKDTMGVVRVPESAYYGPQTQRAVENFPIGDLRLPVEFIRALTLIKRSAAEVNRRLGLLEPGLAQAIVTAAGEILDGRFDDQFVVGVFQTGSGTSTHMNVNEVIASRANELLTGTKGGKSPVHPNDHVNLGQSSNDAIPSAIHIAALVAVRKRLIPALARLHQALAEKAGKFADVRKIGGAVEDHLRGTVGTVAGLRVDEVLELGPEEGSAEVGDQPEEPRGREVVSVEVLERGDLRGVVVHGSGPRS